MNVISKSSVLALALLAGTHSVSTRAAEETFGLALTDARWAVYQSEDGKAECPNGTNDVGAREQFDAQYPPARRPLTLLQSQLVQEGATWFPEEVSGAALLPFREAGGSVAIGLNLDGHLGARDFTSPTGEPGIDNQLYRVIGCIEEFRGPGGRFYNLINRFIRDFQFNRVLLELSGAGNLHDAPAVAVTISRGLDPLAVDATGNAIVPGGSQRVDSRWGRRYIQHLRGRIENGVLITEPADLVLPHSIYESTPGEEAFRGGRFRLTLSADGAEGLLAGYVDIHKWYSHLMQSSSGQFLYPALYSELARLADGFPDATSGANTAISAAMTVRFTRVHIVNSPAVDGPQSPGSLLGKCEPGLSRAFDAGDLTTVRQVKGFKAGDDLNLDGQLSGIQARHDLCMVKLNVGPGNPGAVGAPSTSPGIGIEIWLPMSGRWNRRLHALGGGGWGGMGRVSSLTALEGTRNHFGGVSPAQIADEEGAVSAVTDDGHVGGASFAMLPDGKINAALWKDFASRGVHEMAVKTKRLIAAFYGEPLEHAYFEGVSTGGREGLKLAQDDPQDFDGILAGFAPLYWTRVNAGALVYPRVVVHEALGDRYLSNEQLRAVSAAATTACDATVVPGHHDGFISDPAACHYDPTRDGSVLCHDDGGDNVTGSCLTRQQAHAVNQMWFGQTTDGSVPDASRDNGFHPELSHKQLWFGVSRGIDISKTAGEAVFTANGIEQVALSLQGAQWADSTFHNATGNGADGWKRLSYAELARAQAEGLRLQSLFGDINTEQTDLRGFRDHKGKLLYIHGMADAFIPVQGSHRYYSQVAGKMGGYVRVQQFFRYFPIPGGNHEVVPGPVAGLAGVSPAPDPPVPTRQQLYALLVDWVEQGHAPDEILTKNTAGTLERPLCMFPSRVRYVGGDVSSATSYRCH